MASLNDMTVKISVVDDFPEVKEKIDQLENRVAAYEEGLSCLEGYLSQLPGTGILQQMIKVWFADARQKN